MEREGKMKSRALKYMASATTLALVSLVLPAVLMPSAESCQKHKLASADKGGAANVIFSDLANKYFEQLFKRDPNWGTEIGLHEYDMLAPDLSATAVGEEILELKESKKVFADLKASELSAQAQIDLRLITSHINSRLLSLEEMKDWQNDPGSYPSTVNAMIFELMKRDFAPLETRLKAVIAREKRAAAILSAGKQNLKNPPKIYCEIALEQMPGIINFFKNDVGECFKSVTDKALQDEFKSVNSELIESLESYGKWLKESLLAKSRSDFAIGKDFYAKKILYDEMVDTPLDKLLADGYTELKRLQKEFVATAKRIDPKKSAAEVMTAVSSEHPAPSKLISSTQEMLQSLKDFCVEKKIVTIPSPTDLTVAETPPFKRALSFASMDTPGPFETKATKAYYFVTLPEADWPAERVEEHMRAYCNYDLINTSVHEAYPGHYVQGLWDKKAPSKTTKILGCGSNIEGWAHYTEQMMVEEGLNKGDDKLQLIMWHDALLRCCRYIVGISMHTEGMSMERGIEFFMKEGYQEKANAERETKRGTMSPTYLIYTLGKLQILSLRDDYKKLKGKDFSLQDFHDRFLATGRPPVKVIREIIMH